MFLACMTYVAHVDISEMQTVHQSTRNDTLTVITQQLRSAVQY